MGDSTTFSSSTAAAPSAPKGKFYRGEVSGVVHIEKEHKDAAADASADSSPASSATVGKKSHEAGRGLASIGEAEGTAQQESQNGNGSAPSEASSATAAVASGSSSSSGASSTASDSPWVSYMAGTSKSDLIERLRRNSSLRDALQQRMQELRSQGDGSGMVELLQEALAAAGKEDNLPLKDLKPVSVREAFSMDNEGTESQIRSLLSELSGSEEKLSAETSLFDRNSFALRRSLVRGAVKGPQ